MNCSVASHTVDAQSERAATAGQNRWQKPQPGRYKCNIDATFSAQYNRTGIGMCLRDEHGAFVLAKTMSFSPMFPVATGEVTCLLQVMQWIHDIQFDNVDFVVDSKTTVDAFHSRQTDVMEFSHIITACRDLFSTQFTSFQVEFCPRQSNVLLVH